MTTREIQYNEWFYRRGVQLLAEGEMPPLQAHPVALVSTLTPPPGLVATGAMACPECGKRVDPRQPWSVAWRTGESFCSAKCSNDVYARGAPAAAPISVTSFAGDLTGPMSMTTLAGGQAQVVKRITTRSLNGSTQVVGPVIVTPPAICPLRWCTREVRAHTEAEIARCAEYRGRLRVIEERLRAFQNSIARRFPDAADMPLSAAGEAVWAEKRTEEETEALRRQWSSLR